MKITNVSTETDPTIFTVQLTRQEVWVILRSLGAAATAAAEAGGLDEDASPRRWISERLLRKLQELGYLNISDEYARELMGKAQAEAQAEAKADAEAAAARRARRGRR